MAVFLVKIAQNIIGGVYFEKRKLFLLENCFSLRYDFAIDKNFDLKTYENDDYLDQELFVDDSLRIE